MLKICSFSGLREVRVGTSMCRRYACFSPTSEGSVTPSQSKHWSRHRQVYRTCSTLAQLLTVDTMTKRLRLPSISLRIEECTQCGASLGWQFETLGESMATSLPQVRHTFQVGSVPISVSLPAFPSRFSSWELLRVCRQHFFSSFTKWRWRWSETISISYM